MIKVKTIIFRGNIINIDTYIFSIIKEITILIEKNYEVFVFNN